MIIIGKTSAPIHGGRYNSRIWKGPKIHGATACETAGAVLLVPTLAENFKAKTEQKTTKKIETMPSFSMRCLIGERAI